MKRLSYLVLTTACMLMAFSCQKGNQAEPQPKEKTEWISRTDTFEENYALEQMIVLSRHNIRSPLVSKNSVLTRLTNSTYQWFAWEGAPSSLTAKGES